MHLKSREVADQVVVPDGNRSSFAKHLHRPIVKLGNVDLHFVRRLKGVDREDIGPAAARARNELDSRTVGTRLELRPRGGQA